jgi:hypothetical protein
MDQPTHALTLHQTQLTRLRAALAEADHLGPAWTAALDGLLDAAAAAGPPTGEEPKAPSPRFQDMRRVFGSIELPTDGQERMYIKLFPFDVSLKRDASGLLVEIYDASENAALGAIASAHAFDHDTLAAEEAG